MQVRSKPDVAAVFDRLTANEQPGRRGLEAWRSLLRAHATLMRQLEADLEKRTGLALADFDVLAQLALAGGELRMTDLAVRALISRSGACLGARLAGCKKGMDVTVITSDVTSSFFASRECGLLLGDAREVLRTLADDSLDCTVTSPPYYSGRRHVGDTIHEIGSEKTVEEYVEALESVGREVYRVTKPTGSYWLNLDDKCERKEWLGIPWRVAFAMREIGWKIRSEVIWHKPEHVRKAAKDRLTPAHELFFHFVKSKDAYYDMDAIRKPSSPPIWGKNGVAKTPGGSVPTDVWTIQMEDSNFSENPYAAFPEALVEPPIRATCRRGGTVLDPFVGSGTTAVVALRLGRKAVGIDASADCLEFTKKRILEASGQPATPRQAPLSHTVKVSHGRVR